MMGGIEIFKCDECNRDGVICELKTLGGAPTHCPFGGEEMDADEWCKVAIEEIREEESEAT